MQMTLTTALELLKNGNEQAAWEVAQQDEGMNPGVTKSQWLDFAADCIARQAATDAAYASAPQYD